MGLYDRWRGWRQSADPATEAIVAVAVGLLGARRLDQLSEPLREVLVVGMELERCTLVVREQPDDLGLRCVSSVSEGTEGHFSAQPLPLRFAAREFGPIARALDTGRPACVDDPEALAARSRAQSEETRDRRGEGHFWGHYGIEAILPLTETGTGEGQAVVGLLIVGPRRGGRRIGAARMTQIHALSRMVGPAIARLSEAERLQQQAAAGERELAGTRTQLRNVYEELVETEMQALLGRLIAGIVHEANTPLGTLRSSLDTLGRAVRKYRPFVAERAAAEDPGAGQALRAIDAQAKMIEVLETSRQRLSGLIESLKRFVGLDAAEVKAIDICQAVDDAVTLVGARLGERVRVARSYAEPPPFVRCAPARLSQVLLNLVQNAADAIDGPGEIDLRVSCSGGRVSVALRDSGRGIPAAKLEGILDFAFTMKAGGRVGLRMGLPVCKKMVVEMGGSLAIRSAEGEGTTVVIELPEA